MNNSLIVFNLVTNDGYGILTPDNEFITPPCLKDNQPVLEVYKNRFLFGTSHDFKEKYIIETVRPVLRMKLSQSKLPPVEKNPCMMYVEFEEQWWTISIPPNELQKNVGVIAVADHGLTREKKSLNRASRWWRAALRGLHQSKTDIVLNNIACFSSDRDVTV